MHDVWLRDIFGASGIHSWLMMLANDIAIIALNSGLEWFTRGNVLVTVRLLAENIELMNGRYLLIHVYVCPGDCSFD